MSQSSDTAFHLETPEGIQLRLRPAGAPVRFWAFSLDLLIRFGVLMIIGTAANLIGIFDQGMASAVILLSAFFLEWFYPVYFEVYHRGQTPGKKVMGLTVIMDNGTAVTTQASIIRNFLRTADFIPMAYFLGLISCLLDSRFRRLGDLAAGTQVVYNAQERKKETVEDYSEVKNFPFLLQDDERLAFYAFFDRREKLNVARQMELAEILVNFHGLEKAAAVAEVRAYSNALRKGR